MACIIVGGDKWQTSKFAVEDQLGTPKQPNQGCANDLRFRGTRESGHFMKMDGDYLTSANRPMPINSPTQAISSAFGEGSLTIP